MKILRTISSDEAAIEALLKRARDAYYNTGQFLKLKKAETPKVVKPFVQDTDGVITDAVFDALEDKLREINPHNVILKSVGVAPKKRKIKLPFPMASLDKHKGEAFDVWKVKHPGPYVVSDKVDGVSIGVDYTDGCLAFTRGDGSTGGDISFMAQKLGLPTDVPKGVRARGEIVMPVATFKRLWSEHYANPRNMVSGITNKNELHEALGHCRIYMYDLISPRLKPSAGLAKLKSMGFSVVGHKVFDDLTSGKLLTLLDKRRAETKYEMDGLVVAQDVKTKLSTGNPDTVIAFKSNDRDESAVATVLKIDWRPTRTGLLFPRIMIEPVALRGVTVTYCSGKSAALIKKMGVGAGATIRIARSGDVIPDIREVLKPARVQWPSTKEVGDWEWRGDNLFLSDSDNQSSGSTIAVQRMAFFFTTLGVERFKYATLSKFYEAGYRDVESVLALSQKRFLAVPGTSAKVLMGVWTQLQAAINDVELPRLMYASGVFGRNFGSRRLAAVVKALPDILNWNKSNSALVEAIDSIEGFDLTTSKQFADNLKAFNTWLSRVPSVKWTAPKTRKVVGGRLKGQRVVMTGFRDSALTAEIESQGGEVIDNVKKATVLLAKDPNGSSSKLGTARQLKIPVMTVEMFKRSYLK